MDTSKEISREDLQAWLNTHAYETAFAMGGYAWVGLGRHPFLYTKRGTLSFDEMTKAPGSTKIVVMKYNKDGEDTEICSYLIPPGGWPYLTVQVITQAAYKARHRWEMPHVPPGRSFPARQTRPFPEGPHSDRILYYVLRDTDKKTFLTYPGSQAVLRVKTQPLAQALCEAFYSKDHCYNVCWVVKDGEEAREWNELPRSAFEYREGWVYPKAEEAASEPENNQENQ